VRVPSFDDVLRRLREAGQGRHGTGADERHVAQLEQELRVTFPEGYRSFLREVGWLSFTGTEVLGLGEDVPPGLDIRAVADEAHRGGLPQNLVPFARDASLGIYCLDAAHSGPYESPVYRWQPEAAVEAAEYVAHDFSSWLWMRLAGEV
jgi:hypothetical protein